MIDLALKVKIQAINSNGNHPKWFIYKKLIQFNDIDETQQPSCPVPHTQKRCFSLFIARYHFACQYISASFLIYNHFLFWPPLEKKKKIEFYKFPKIKVWLIWNKRSITFANFFHFFLCFTLHILSDVTVSMLFFFIFISPVLFYYSNL